MATDLQIVPLTEGEFDFEPQGKISDTGLALLQRLYTVMLSSYDEGSYRDADVDCDILAFLEGGNIPEDGVMDSMLAICCAETLRAMPDDDRSLIESFSGYSDDGKIYFELVLTDGTSIVKELKYV